MVKAEIEKKGCSTRRWLWLVMALVAVFVAMAMSSRTSPKALFGAIDRACPCARVIFLNNPHFKFPYSFFLLNCGILNLDVLFSFIVF